MKRTNIKSKNKGKSFEESELDYIPPWYIHEKLAFGANLLPQLIQTLNLCRREIILLKYLRTLSHLMSDPELCLKALQLDVLKTLARLIIRQGHKVKLWCMIALCVISGNPHGKVSIVKKPILFQEILHSFTFNLRQIREMAYAIVGKLSTNWFAVKLLQKEDCIHLVLTTLFALTDEQLITENENSVICLLEALANLMDSKDGTQQAIRFDVFKLSWLLNCGLPNVERGVLIVFKRAAKYEDGRIGLRSYNIDKELLIRLEEAVNQGEDLSTLGILMFSTLSNNDRNDYLQSQIIQKMLRTFQKPNVTSSCRLAILKILNTMVELPKGREIAKVCLQNLITVQLCDLKVREAVEVLVDKILKTV